MADNLSSYRTPVGYATVRGRAILSLLCLATFLDVMDGGIANVAMPTIRAHLGFSVQNLQWVISGYLITYGGFLLLGGRAADLVGRRRLLVSGTTLAAADATQMIAWAGFWAMFFFVTLYMQNVLGFSQLESGLSYLPVSVGIGFGSTVATKMFMKTGTRPFIVGGSLLSAGGILWLSRIPVHGSYLGNLLVPLVIMGTGLGLLYAGVQTATNAGVPPEQAGLAAALITASFQLGSALGLAVFSGIATSRTTRLLAAHTAAPQALTEGFQRGLLVSALCLAAAAVIALRAPNTRGVPAPATEGIEPAHDPA